ncbi:hypothetical protein J1N35_001806 [Gossypium stocksii]|uniref:Uncharacterized protein n=1 Tax=Gossypium stocksii TaxID=47602 RepID=A0A9D4AMP9_9ROSI|nr:hypothetical protein J1N35_001806 [Gossypium stocksii]
MNLELFEATNKKVYILLQTLQRIHLRKSPNEEVNIVRMHPSLHLRKVIPEEIQYHDSYSTRNLRRSKGNYEFEPYYDDERESPSNSSYAQRLSSTKIQSRKHDYISYVEPSTLSQRKATHFDSLKLSPTCNKVKKTCEKEFEREKEIKEKECEK